MSVPANRIPCPNDCGYEYHFAGNPCPMEGSHRFGESSVRTVAGLPPMHDDDDDVLPDDLAHFSLEASPYGDVPGIIYRGAIPLSEFNEYGIWDHPQNSVSVDVFGAPEPVTDQVTEREMVLTATSPDMPEVYDQMGKNLESRSAQVMLREAALACASNSRDFGWISHADVETGALQFTYGHGISSDSQPTPTEVIDSVMDRKDASRMVQRRNDNGDLDLLASQGIKPTFTQYTDEFGQRQTVVDRAAVIQQMRRNGIRHDSSFNLDKTNRGDLDAIDDLHGSRLDRVLISPTTDGRTTKVLSAAARMYGGSVSKAMERGEQTVDEDGDFQYNYEPVLLYHFPSRERADAFYAQLRDL